MVAEEVTFMARGQALYTVAFTASSDIEPGSELLYDYGEKYDMQNLHPEPWKVELGLELKRKRPEATDDEDDKTAIQPAMQQWHNYRLCAGPCQLIKPNTNDYFDNASNDNWCRMCYRKRYIRVVGDRCNKLKRRKAASRLYAQLRCSENDKHRPTSQSYPHCGDCPYKHAVEAKCGVCGVWIPAGSLFIHSRHKHGIE